MVLFAAPEGLGPVPDGVLAEPSEISLLAGSGGDLDGLLDGVAVQDRLAEGDLQGLGHAHLHPVQRVDGGVGLVGSGDGRERARTVGLASGGVHHGVREVVARVELEVPAEVQAAPSALWVPFTVSPSALVRATLSMCPCVTLRDTGAPGLTCFASSEGATSSSAGATTGTARPSVVRAGDPASEEMGACASPGAAAAKAPPPAAKAQTAASRAILRRLLQVFTAITGPRHFHTSSCQHRRVTLEGRTDWTTIRLQKAPQNGHNKGARGCSPGPPWTGLVAVVAGLVRAGHVDVEVLGLLF